MFCNVIQLLYLQTRIPRFILGRVHTNTKNGFMSHNGELCFTLGNSLNSDDFTCFVKEACQSSYFVSMNSPYILWPLLTLQALIAFPFLP